MEYVPSGFRENSSVYFLLFMAPCLSHFPTILGEAVSVKVGVTISVGDKVGGIVFVGMVGVITSVVDKVGGVVFVNVEILPVCLAPQFDNNPHINPAKIRIEILWIFFMSLTFLSQKKEFSPTPCAQRSGRVGRTKLILLDSSPKPTTSKTQSRGPKPPARAAPVPNSEGARENLSPRGAQVPG
jgi:hypothetical protein